MESRPAAHRGRRRNGQGEAENGTSWQGCRKPEKTTMLLDHGAAQAQPQAHAFDLGGEKRREQLSFVDKKLGVHLVQ